MTYYSAATDNLVVTLIERGDTLRVRVCPAGLESRGLVIRPVDVPELVRALQGAERALRKIAPPAAATSGP